MFFLFKIFSAILSFLAPQQKPPANAVASKLSDFQLPRAGEGDPVPRWYGTLKYKSPNTLFAGEFNAYAIRKKVSTGIFSHKHITTGYKYYVTLDLGICLGPGFTFRRIWIGNNEIWNGCLDGCVNTEAVDYPNLFGGPDQGGGFQSFFTMYCGNYDQENNSYVENVIFPDASNVYPAYNGVAHIVFHHAYVGNSSNLDAFSVEGSCFFDSLGIGGKHIMPNGFDMNAVCVLHHILTDDWGNLDIDPAKINVDQWTTVANTVFDSAIGGMSLVVSNAGQAADAVKAILTQINATIFQNPATGLYDLVLLQDDYDIDTLPILGPGEIKSIQNFTKSLWSETLNTVRVKFTDRTQGYKESVTAQAIDFANIRFQGKSRPSEITSETIYDPNVANMVAARELSNVNVPLYSTTLTMNRMGNALPPGSVFKFNWPEYGIESMVMRVRKLGLGTLNDGTVTMDVIQDIFSVADVIMAPPAPSPYIPPSQAPSAIVDYDVFELPYWLDYNAAINSPAGYQSVGIFAKAPSSFSVGFDANVADAELLDRAPYTITAKLVADLDRFNGFVSGIMPTLVIKTISDTTVLVTGSPALGSGLFMLNDEILGYEDFHDNGDGTFNLLNVHRALLDTVYTAGLINDVLFFMADQNTLLGDPFIVGTPFDLKLSDVTPTGVYDAGPTVTVTPTGRLGLPVPPDGLALAGTRDTGSVQASGDTGTLTWVARNRLVTPTAIPYEAGAGQAPEDGTTYKLDIIAADGVTVLDTIDDIPAETVDIDFTDDMAPNVVLNVYAKVGGELSFKPAIYPVAVLSGLLVDGDAVTIDGDGIEI